MKRFFRSMADFANDVCAYFFLAVLMVYGFLAGDEPYVDDPYC